MGMLEVAKFATQFLALRGKYTMAYQNITASLSPEDIQEIKAALQTIQKNLPFLITLSTEERRRLVKMGDKSLAFVSNSVTAAQSNPSILYFARAQLELNRYPF